MAKLSVIGWSLAGGIAIHVMLLSCSAVEHGTAASDAPAATHLGAVDAMLDAVLPDAPRARAEADSGSPGACTCEGVKLRTYVEPCNKYAPGVGSGGYTTAEHVFPGATEAQLMTVTAYYASSHALHRMPAGYTHRASEKIWIGPERVMAYCYDEKDTLTFVAPF